jgi:hypothetical protein
MDNTINDNKLSFAVVPYTPKIRFLASLSNGRTVIQDNRPNQRHAWARLAEWIKDNPSIAITELRLQAPNGVNITMPPNQKGYFFGRKRYAIWNGAQHEYLGIGYYDGQKVNVAWYRQPSFDHSFTEDRTVSNSGFFLIRNL